MLVIVCICFIIILTVNSMLSLVEYVRGGIFHSRQRTYRITFAAQPSEQLGCAQTHFDPIIYELIMRMLHKQSCVQSVFGRR